VQLIAIQGLMIMSFFGSSRFEVEVILQIEEQGLHIPANEAQARAGHLVSEAMLPDF
jgi:hypothetical protein